MTNYITVISSIVLFYSIFYPAWPPQAFLLFCSFCNSIIFFKAFMVFLQYNMAVKILSKYQFLRLRNEIYIGYSMCFAPYMYVYVFNLLRFFFTKFSFYKFLSKTLLKYAFLNYKLAKDKKLVTLLWDHGNGNREEIQGELQLNCCCLHQVDFFDFLYCQNFLLKREIIN